MIKKKFSNQIFSNKGEVINVTNKTKVASIKIQENKLLSKKQSSDGKKEIVLFMDELIFS